MPSKSLSAGPFYGGQQYVSWVTDEDVAGAIAFLLEHDEIDGVVNVTSPNPLRNRDLMRHLREAAGMPLGLPVVPGMAELGAWMLGTDVELMRKSRRVVPERLLGAGYRFSNPTWPEAARSLVTRWRAGDSLRRSGADDAVEPILDGGPKART